MNNHLKKIRFYEGQAFLQAKLWFRELSRAKQLALVGAVFLVVFFALAALFNSEEEKIDSLVVNRKVVVASVASLSNLEGDFPLVGTVTSVSEATIRSEGGGKLTRVYKKLGDTVYAGGIIGEFENSAERAAVLQSEGAYEQAKASRDLVTISGTINTLNSGQTGSSFIDTKNQALNTISSTYTTLDDAVRGKTDIAYKDPEFQEVKFLLTVPDANLIINLENKRRSIQVLLKARESKNKTLTIDSNLAIELNTLQSETQMIKGYLDDLFNAYSKALPDSIYSQATLDAGKASVQGARQAVTNSLSLIVSARTALSAGQTATEVAGNQGGQNLGAVASADAQVKQALGAYNAALSRLEKTVIRSPITGTLNSLTISTGDYIGAFTQVAVVSNNGALEVVSLVTEDDAKRITVGSPVTINGNIEAIVTRIASAIDPTTNKIEVRIGIKSNKSTLVNGQSVRISVTKDKKTVTKASNSPIVIPIGALKLTPRGATVFTISASSTLVALPVKEGAILGEQIQILEGLTGSEEIVVDARGLKEGSLVEVSNN